MHDHGPDCAHDHSHGSGHIHSHAPRTSAGASPALLSRLWWAFGINFVWLIVEVVGGYITGSLALLADAGHMLTDVAALGLAIFVGYLARTPRTPTRTFGLLRAEVIGAFLNGATLVVIVGFIFYEAWRRLGQPQQVEAPLMLAIAAIGLAANAGSAWVLMSHQAASVNVRGAFLHLVGDALGSVGAIVAGVVIWTTGWTPIDPLASVVIGLIILWGSIGLLRNTTHILLNAVPPQIDYAAVLGALQSHDHCAEVHDLHIWSITEGEPALSAHVVLVPECSDSAHWQQCQAELSAMLRARFGITHSTIQLEPGTMQRHERII